MHFCVCVYIYVVCIYFHTYALTHIYSYTLNLHVSDFTFTLCGSVHFIVVYFIKDSSKITNASLSSGWGMFYVRFNQYR